MDALPAHTRSLPEASSSDSKRKLDLLQFIGPNTYDVLPAGLLDALKSRGMNVLTYGDGVAPGRNKKLKRLINEALGDDGHLVLSMHGNVAIRKSATKLTDGTGRFQLYQNKNAAPLVRSNARHVAHIDQGSEYGKVPTASIFRWVHGSGEQEGPSRRLIHLLSCDSDAVLHEIRPGSKEWKAGYTLIHGGDGLRNYTNNTSSLLVALEYLTECKNENKSAHPLVLFARAGLARADALTLIGGDLDGPVHFSEPTRLADLGVDGISTQISGSPKDIIRIKAALIARGEGTFELDASMQLRDYVFTRVTRQDVAGLKEALDAHPELCDAQDEQGFSLLHLAVGFGHRAVVELLLKSGARADRQDNPSGRSPLMDAAAAGNEEMVKLLLEFGANPGLRDQGHFTAADFAHSEGHSKLGDYLMVEATTRKE